MEEKNYLIYDLMNCIKEFPDEEGFDDEFYINLLIEPLLEAVKESKVLLKHCKVTKLAEDKFEIVLKISLTMENLLDEDGKIYTPAIHNKVYLDSCNEDFVHLLLLDALARKALIYLIALFDASTKATLPDGDALYVINERFTLGTVR